MSGFLSPKYLKWRGGKLPPVDIDYDRPCHGCGYNLRGLKIGGRCPECGMLIERTAGGAKIDVIVPDDPAARSRMMQGLLAAGAGLFLLVMLRFWAITPLPRPELALVDSMSLLASTIWIAGVWLITPPRMDDYGRMMRPARRAARLLAFAWPIAFVMLLLEGVTGGWSWWIWLAARVLGGVGVMVLLLMLLVPAEDAGYDDEARRLGIAFWGLLIFGSIAGLVPRDLTPVDWGWFMYSFIAILIGTWLIFALLAVYGLLSLMWATTYASRHLLELGTRSERIRETRAEIDREVASRIRRLGD